MMNRQLGENVLAFYDFLIVKDSFAIALLRYI